MIGNNHSFADYPELVLMNFLAGFRFCLGVFWLVWLAGFCFPSLIRSYRLEVQRRFALIHSRFPAVLERGGR